MLLGGDLMNVVMEDFIIKHFGVVKTWVVKYWKVNDGFVVFCRVHGPQKYENLEDGLREHKNCFRKYLKSINALIEAS